MSVDTGELVSKIELADIIKGRRESKCRFLHFQNKKLYVVDLGLDLVYVVTMKTSTVRAFGGHGKEAGKFSDPAGIAVDCRGNMIVADSRCEEKYAASPCNLSICSIGWLNSYGIGRPEFFH